MFLWLNGNQFKEGNQIKLPDHIGAINSPTGNTSNIGSTDIPVIPACKGNMTSLVQNKDIPTLNAASATSMEE